MSDHFPLQMHKHPKAESFFDEPSNTFSYVVSDPESGHCAIIDPVLDLDYAAGRFDHRSADAIVAYVRENGLTVD